MSDNNKKTENISMAEHVAETHRNMERNRTVVTGDIVSGVVRKDGDNNAEENQDSGDDS